MLKKQSQLKMYADPEDTGSNTGGNTGSGSGWSWDSLFSNIGGMLQGVGSIIGASKGNPTLGNVNVYSTEQTESKKSNVGLYIILGVVLIAVIAGVIMLTKKK